MVWMEMIQLRTTRTQPESVARLLIDTVKRAKEEAGLLHIHMYRSANYQTDLALSLVWDTNSVDHEGSKTGMSISEALKTFGLVEHSIWTEREAP
jgi:hypothetical protein